MPIFRPRKSDADLFRESTMTFGEHLEELRVCLFKAVAGLAVGFIIGLFVANYLVKFIQYPLNRALSNYYQEVSERQVRTKLAKLQAEGLPIPGSPNEVAAMAVRENLLADEILIQPAETLQELPALYRSAREKQAERLKQLQAAAPLLERMKLAPDDPRAKLSDPEWEQLARGVQLVKPTEGNAAAAKADMPPEVFDRALAAIEANKAPVAEDLAQVSAAAAREIGLCRATIARLAEAIQLIDHIKLPPKGQEEVVTRKDLVRLFVWRPVEEDARVRAKSLSAQEAFTIYVQAAFLIGIVGTSPWIFWQLWLFVGAGLYHHERRYVHIFLPFSLILFLIGVCLAFFFVMETVLTFLFQFNDWMGIDPDPRISEWLSFVLVMPLAFGIGFQLPLVMLFLERIGIFDVKAYWAKWKIAVLIIAVLAAVLTPSPDPWSMLLMGTPLCALYFGGILLCRVMPRGASRYEEIEEPAD